MSQQKVKSPKPIRPVSNEDFVQMLEKQLNEAKEFSERLDRTPEEEIHSDVRPCLDEHIEYLEADILYFTDYHTYDPG